MGSAKNRTSFAFAVCLCVSQFVWPLAGAFAQSASASVAAPATPPPGYQVKPAGPDVLSAKSIGANRFRLTVTGHVFSGRENIEKYLAYRAAQLTLEHKSSWFSFVETRAKGGAAAKLTRDPAGMRYSFRMAYFRPFWR